MPILTLGQMISRATELAGGRLDWLQSDGSFYINQAAGYVARAAGIQHRSLESSYATTITSGVSIMVLPGDYDTPVSFSIGSSIASAGGSASTQWRTLGKRDIGWGDVFAKRLDNGIPEAYIEFNSRFEIIPSPNSSYSLVLRYRRQLEELVASTGTYGLDQQWHWAVVLKGAELLAQSRGDFQMEQVCRSRYIDYMSVMLPDQGKKWMDLRGAFQPLPRQPSGQTAIL